MQEKTPILYTKQLENAKKKKNPNSGKV